MEKIWKGAFAPGFTKGVITASFDPDNVRNPEDHDPDGVYGVMTVTFHNGSYEWDEVTYQQFLDFEASGFSTSYLMNHFPISPGRR